MKSYNNSNNNGNNRKKHSFPTFPPPKRVPFTISAPQVKAWCRNVYQSGDLENIWELYNNLRAARIAIMQLNQPKPLEIKIEIIRQVENMPGFDKRTMVGIFNGMSNNFDSVQWLHIYFAMLPDHTCLDLTQFTTFNDQLLVILKIYTDIVSVWNTVEKAKLTEKWKEQEIEYIKLFRKKKPIYGVEFNNEEDITKYCNSKLYEEINNLTTSMYAKIGEYEDYLKKGSLDLHDLKTQMIFREITFDPLMVPSGYTDVNNLPQIFIIDKNGNPNYPMNQALKVSGELITNFWQDNNIPEDCTLADITREQWEDWIMRIFYHDVINEFTLREFSFGGRAYLQQFNLPMYNSVKYIDTQYNDLQLINNYRSKFTTFYNNCWNNHHDRINSKWYNALGILDRTGKVQYQTYINNVSQNDYIPSFICFTGFNMDNVRQDICRTVLSIDVGYEDTFRQSFHKEYQIALLLILGQFRDGINNNINTVRNMVTNILQQNYQSKSYKFEFWALLMYFMFVENCFIGVDVHTTIKTVFNSVDRNIKIQILYGLYYMFTEFTDSFNANDKTFVIELCNSIYGNVNSYYKTVLKYIMDHMV